ncbi:hypothetical protein GCM10029964_052470 [Kibdelosporangium lantanae]
MVGGPYQAVHEGGERGGDGDGAAQAQCVAPGGVGLQVEHLQADQHDRETDGHVDEQAPPPAAQAGEHTAEDHAGGGTKAGDRGVEAERALLPFAAEQDGQQGQPGWSGQGGARALEHPAH